MAVGLTGLGLMMVSPSPGLAATSAVSLTNAAERTWGTNGRVLAMLPVGDRVYVAGDFTAVSDPGGNTYPVENLAVFFPASGAFDTSWHPNPNGSVNALAYSGGALYVGGDFTTIDDGQLASRLAEIDAGTGKLNPAWAAGANNLVSSLTVSNNMVYVGGTFTQLTDSAGNQGHSYLGRVSGGDGSVDNNWNPIPSAQVRSVVISGDGTQVFVGGDFTSVSGRTATHIASLDTVSGSLTPGFTSGSTNGAARPPVYGLSVDGPNLLAAVGGAGGACASLKASTGASQWSNHTNGNVQAVTVLDGVVYCGGHFNGAGGFATLTRHKLAAVDEQTGAALSFAPVINSSLGVWSVSGDADHLYVGGDFTKITSKAQSRFGVFVDDASKTVAGAPQGFAARPGDRSARLFWSLPWTDGGAAVTRYRIYRGVGGGALTALTTTKLTSWTDTGLTDGMSYQYAVTALNAVGESVWSSTQTMTPAPNSYLPPTAPQILSATDSSGQAHLTWGVPADDGQSPITSYLILRSTQQGAEQQIDAVSAPSTSYTDSQVSADTTYYYRVVAVNAIGDSPPSNEGSVTITAVKPSQPTLFVSTASGSVTLKWSDPDPGTYPITKYTILRDGIQYDHLKATGSASYSYVDSDAVSGTTYTYRLRATSPAGNSPLSDPVTVKTP